MTAINLYCDKGHVRLEIGRLVNHAAVSRLWSLRHPVTGHRRDLTKMVQILAPDGSLVYSDPGKARETGHEYLGDVSYDVNLTRRYRLSCQECHTRVVVKDQAPLWTCLQTMADRGIAEVRLTELAAALRYSAEQ